MRLKALRLYGFKSFPQKTVLELSPGMTALVGPNGCGKSNVLDAIRWVLGEQTLSRLRCGRSEDLVFSGSSRLSELGYADVALTVDNNGDFPDLPAEVEIRRRYYRSGESGFWINREECRLKEIEAILRGGAAGGRLYSVFDRSQLAGIVGGELHNLLESAAGVLGFRERRKESERKLQLVRRDLTRLDDIIRERQRIVRSLASQKRKAKLYKELKEEMAGLQARKIVARLEALDLEINQKQEEINTCESRERKMILQLETIRAELKDKDIQLQALLDAERQARIRMDEIGARLSEVKAVLSSSRTRKESLLESRQRISSEIAEAQKRLAEADAEIEKASDSASQAALRRNDAEDKLSQARLNLKADEEELATRRTEVKTLREETRVISSTLSEHVEERTQLRSHIANCQALSANAKDELDKIQTRNQHIREQQAKVSAELQDLSTSMRTGEERIKSLEQNLEKITDGIKESDDEHRYCIQNQSKLAGQIASLRDKLDKKSRQLLKKQLGDRFKGALEEYLEYPPELEAALEAILYDILGFAASRGLPDLSGMDLEGQAGLIVDRQIDDARIERVADDKFRSWVADKVKVKPDAPAMLVSRLVNWVVVDEADILILTDRYPGLSFVTVQGTALRSDGVSLFGRPKGILADMRRLGEMEKQAADLEKENKLLTSGLAELREKREEIENKLDHSRQIHLEQISRKGALDAEKDRIVRQLSETGKERDRLRGNIGSQQEEIETTSSRLQALEKKISELEADRQIREKKLTDMEQSLSEEEDRLRDKLAGLNEHLLALGREEETEKAARGRQDQLQTERERLDELIRTRGTEMEKNAQEMGILDEKIKELDKENTSLTSERALAQEELAGMDTSTLMETKHGMETTLEENEAELEKLRQVLVRLRTDILLLKREHENLFQVLPSPEQAAGQQHTVVSSPEQLSPEEIEQKIANIERRLAELGLVNEYAAVQHQEESEELDRIKSQYEDVTKAGESLAAIIREIDEEARSRFQDTFKRVREEFRQTFTFFFPGGEANLKLDNIDDPFNSPIQIFARPEGKQVKRLSQLSDGERTMLGISLLFAFYAVRPAPFLFVDELDAPLDDNNVLKFASYLAHIKDRIQVFVITHNKRTMEKADAIYGVTMEEPGVSRIISVKLKDVKRHHVAIEEEV